MERVQCKLDPGQRGSEVQLEEDRKLECDGYWFEPALADRFEIFCSKYVCLSKGEWGGQPLILQEWQREDMRRLFGWCRPDGTRRYREYDLWIPKKNGKSTMASAISLFLLTADNERGAEIYAAAGSKEQANTVFAEAKNMVTQSPYLNSILNNYKSSIFYQEKMSSFQAISSKPNTKHGPNPHGIICDELHAWTSRELYDVLSMAFGSRRQPLEVVISTAGNDIESFGHAMFDIAQKLQQGILSDPHTLAKVWAADPEDDYRDPRVWAKANPGFGVSPKAEVFERGLKSIEKDPGKLPRFLQLYLNIWRSDVKSWLSIDAWKACARPKKSWEKYKGRKCWAGLDLSSNIDLSAFVMYFPNDDGTFDVVPKFWCPADQAEERARTDRVQYPLWIAQGLIHATPGNVIDYRYIKKTICEVAKHVELMEVGYDKHGATELALSLQDDHGITMVPISQNIMSLSEPAKALERSILGKELRHDGNPVLAWMASNVAIYTDPNENIKLMKNKSRSRIDGIVALVMALLRARLGQSTVSVYESRGALSA